MRWCSLGTLAFLGLQGAAFTFLSFSCKEWHGGEEAGKAADPGKSHGQAAGVSSQMVDVIQIGKALHDSLASLDAKQANGEYKKQAKALQDTMSILNSEVKRLGGEGFLGSREKTAAAAPIPFPPASAAGSPSLKVRNRHLILDVGFNEGGDAHHYLSHGYDVVGVEANPHLIEKAGEVDSVFRPFLDTGQLRLLQVGVAAPEAQSEELIFWEHPKKSYWGQLGKPHQACKDHTKTPPKFECIAHKVPMMTCQEIIDKVGVPLYIKVDIEKQDGDCIISLAQKADPCQLPFYVSFERSAKFKEAMGHLGLLGYRFFKQVLQREWDRKQRFTSIKQASGPFGEWAVDDLSNKKMLNGQFVSNGAEQVGHLWKYSNDTEKLFGRNERPPGNWVDIHARLDGPIVTCERTKV